MQIKEQPVSSTAHPEVQSPTDEPSQHFGTAGIEPMTRPSHVTRLFMRIVAGVERLNLACSVLGNPPIYDKAVFPWAREIEQAWPSIRAELERVLKRQAELPGFHEISTDVATISTDRGWKTFLLCGYGFRSGANIARCPATWAACQKIPGLITAMFSILEDLPLARGRGGDLRRRLRA
jgi:beta-hydroxylase